MGVFNEILNYRKHDVMAALRLTNGHVEPHTFSKGGYPLEKTMVHMAWKQGLEQILINGDTLHPQQIIELFQLEQALVELPVIHEPQTVELAGMSRNISRYDRQEAEITNKVGNEIVYTAWANPVKLERKEIFGRCRLSERYSIGSNRETVHAYGVELLGQGLWLIQSANRNYNGEQKGISRIYDSWGNALR